MTGQGNPSDPDRDPVVVSYFVASFVPAATARRLARLAARFPAGIEPQPAQRLHLTWRSFDGLPAGRLHSLEAALEAVSGRHAGLTLELLGGGVFPEGAVWARGCPSAAITKFQSDIDAALTSLGIPPASHPFVPHVTLGAGPPGTRPPGFLHDLATRLCIDGFALTTTGNKPYRVVRRYALAG